MLQLFLKYATIYQNPFYPQLCYRSELYYWTSVFLMSLWLEYFWISWFWAKGKIYWTPVNYFPPFPFLLFKTSSIFVAVVLFVSFFCLFLYFCLVGWLAGCFLVCLGFIFTLFYFIQHSLVSSCKKSTGKADLKSAKRAAVLLAGHLFQNPFPHSVKGLFITQGTEVGRQRGTPTNQKAASCLWDSPLSSAARSATAFLWQEV